MKGVIGNMNKKIIMFSLLIIGITNSAFADDNEIYIDQSGASSSIDVEQLGSGNLLGGLNSQAGSLNPFDLDGTSMTLDLNFS